VVAHGKLTERFGSLSGACCSITITIGDHRNHLRTRFVSEVLLTLTCTAVPATAEPTLWNRRWWSTRACEKSIRPYRIRCLVRRYALRVDVLLTPTNRSTLPSDYGFRTIFNHPTIPARTRTRNRYHNAVRRVRFDRVLFRELETAHVVMNPTRSSEHINNYCPLSVSASHCIEMHTIGRHETRILFTTMSYPVKISETFRINYYPLVFRSCPDLRGQPNQITVNYKSSP
jgi:hypothetical protein